MDDSTRVVLVRLVVDDDTEAEEVHPREPLTEEQAIMLWWWSVVFGDQHERWAG